MIQVIGIDPGTHTGLGHVQDGEFVELQETTFWGAYEYVMEMATQDVSLVVIEVSPRKQTVLWHHNANNSRKGGRIGQDVGGVRLQGELLAEGLRRAGYRVKTMAPVGKVDHNVFKAVTGYDGRRCNKTNRDETNEHKRDAGMLAWHEYRQLLQIERIQQA